MGSTTITGNNGMYKRSMFAKVSFDKNLREGEDVDFNHRSKAAGFSSYCIPGLTVEHQEHKSFLRSMQWLYQSGIGATRQLFRFREIRLPDLAFFATIGSLLLAIVLACVAGTALGFMVPVLGVLGASVLHMRGKFYLPSSRPLAVIGALATDALLVACYYVGRTVGPFVYLANKRDATK
jgi:GT2 family glycosyltransferase